VPVYWVVHENRICKMSVWQTLWRYRSTLVFILTPILLLPLPIAVPETVSIRLFLKCQPDLQ